MTASGKFSNQAGMNLLNELSWQEEDTSLESLALQPIPEQIKLYQHLVHEREHDINKDVCNGEDELLILQVPSSHQPTRLADTSVCSASTG